MILQFHYEEHGLLIGKGRPRSAEETLSCLCDGESSKQTQWSTHTRTHAHTHTRTHAHTHTHTHTHTHRQIHTLSGQHSPHNQIPTSTQVNSIDFISHTPTHSPIHTHSLTHAHTRTHAHTHTQTSSDTYRAQK